MSWPLPERRHFASGVNTPGDFRGLAMFPSWGVGVTATDVRTALLEEVSLYRGAPLRVFVDSGAFSEVDFAAEGRVVVAPISDRDWLERLGTYRRFCAILFPSQVYPVAPDSVGDQRETLERLERYAPQVRELVDLGANVIVPCQRGGMALSAFFARACEVLRVETPQVIAGVPMEKGATGLGELAELCAGFYVGGRARLHFLGLGPESKRYEPALEVAKLSCPWVEITSDSVSVRRMVGRDNGKGGGPRALTSAQDAVRAEGHDDSFTVKSAALMSLGHAALRTEAQEARRRGWFDEELESAPGVPLEPGCIEYGPGGPFGDDDAPDGNGQLGLDLAGTRAA